MNCDNVVPFPPKGTPPSSVWTLFVLADLRQFFVTEGPPKAVSVIEDAIQELEKVLIPESCDQSAAELSASIAWEGETSS
ncbi:hypothetical protein [Tateyamaria sp. ANG-S1]|uniref:hypothetical protein n=1 Tax=Tateyamaria sp. ANG-S1 TaxID=1577905 RepID=UPI0005837308|nr:hypothetical protein [Tateyamaria sp. ANG-S1]KIC48204.1 hypothetical protein RA29_16765 [Tateyamaria sp. ANG-S1]